MIQTQDLRSVMERGYIEWKKRRYNGEKEKIAEKEDGNRLIDGK